MENRTLNITFKKPRYHENPRKKKNQKRRYYENPEKQIEYQKRGYQ